VQPDIGAANVLRVLREDIAALPRLPGVYRFRDQRGRVLYIGRAVSLRSRVASYWGDLGSRGHLVPMVARIARVQALVCDSGHEAAWLERNLLEQGLPPWNRTAGGQEVPVFIRLDLQPRSAGLTVVHGAGTPRRPWQGRSEPDEQAAPAMPAAPAGPAGLYFGPYLGGLRVRLAASALHRVLPLRYAADGLHGWSRDMAAIRGIGPGDRAFMNETVTAVLNRDPEAVAWLLGELTGRRDSAAAGLAFELAARLQEEIRAVGWVTAEQKVTRADAADQDIHGWADGVLVSLAVRAGRLIGWRQRPCTQAAARPLVEVTPAAWLSFAQRNAELAARLARPGLSFDS
jgi:excinuclease ABC subunit C